MTELLNSIPYEVRSLIFLLPTLLWFHLVFRIATSESVHRFVSVTFANDHVIGVDAANMH